MCNSTINVLDKEVLLASIGKTSHSIKEPSVNKLNVLSLLRKYKARMTCSSINILCSKDIYLFITSEASKDNDLDNKNGVLLYEDMLINCSEFLSYKYVFYCNRIQQCNLPDLTNIKLILCNALDINDLSNFYVVY